MGDSADDYDIEFNFENESLKHRMDSTMREDMFQVSQRTFIPAKSHYLYFDQFRVGLTASLRTSTRSSNSCIWAPSLNTLVTSTKKDSLLIPSSPSSISWKRRTCTRNWTSRRRSTSSHLASSKRSNAPSLCSLQRLMWQAVASLAISNSTKLSNCCRLTTWLRTISEYCWPWLMRMSQEILPGRTLFPSALTQ